MKNHVRGYAVCGSPRSGSTYLLYLLRSTGVLGKPSEWLRGDGGPANDDYPSYTHDFDLQLQHVLTDGATENGVYALKMFPEHFDSTLPSRWALRLPRLSYIHIAREDVLGQAVSLAIARQTQSYAHWIREAVEPRYDGGQIRRCLDFILTGEARWGAFFAINDIQPLRVQYQALVERPEEAVASIASLMGVDDASIDWTAHMTRPQRTERNDAWRARFISELGDLSILPTLGASLSVTDTLL